MGHGAASAVCVRARARARRGARRAAARTSREIAFRMRSLVGPALCSQLVAPALRTFMQRRSLIVHVPVLAGAAKVGTAAAALAAKKFAVSRIVGKLGVERAFQELHKLNRALERSGAYSPEVATAAADGLEQLDRSLAGLKEDERVKVAWQWYEGLEKNNPTLASAVLKTYMETLPGARWASAVLKGTPSREADGSAQEHAGGSSDGDEADGGEPALSLVRRLRAQHPELSKYDIILMPREELEREEQQGDASAPP